ncbi:hypothetical protein C8Q70DRAFT_1021346 [Cubamyces menziesii]|nr:hypothetical protein C8Q70DRAFT_1021346 [Cubamyces menziesii]
MISPMVRSTEKHSPEIRNPDRSQEHPFRWTVRSSLMLGSTLPVNYWQPLDEGLVSKFRGTST